MKNQSATSDLASRCRRRCGKRRSKRRREPGLPRHRLHDFGGASRTTGGAGRHGRLGQRAQEARRLLVRGTG